MKVLTYLIYGNKREYQLELALSVLSALQFLTKSQESVTICVVSDRHDIGLDLPIDRLVISPKEFAEWTQAGTYHYRAKILALMKAIDHYQAPAVLVDTDTVFLQSPARLFDRISPQQSVMHDFEYEIRDVPYWKPLLEKLGDGIEIEGMQIVPRSPMYNSGVIGIDVANRSLLDKALAVQDKLYALSPIFNIEQFAVTIPLYHYTQLVTSTDVIWHYWGLHRDFIHVQTDRLLQSASLANLDTLLANLAALKLGVPAKPPLEKAMNRLLGFTKRWDNDYRFAHLCYRCALFYSTKDGEYANAWAKLALGGVKRSIDPMMIRPDDVRADCIPVSIIQRDFQQFAPSRLAGLSWLKPAVQQSWMQFWQAS